MKEDGRLQHYIDSLAEEVETSILPKEMLEVFEGEVVIRAQIIRYALDTGSHVSKDDLMAICKEARLIHDNQDSIVYRRAFGVFWTNCTRHKEFAMHLLFKDAIKQQCNLVPSMISFLKLNTP